MKFVEAYVEILKRENRELRRENNDLREEIERLKEIIAEKEEVKGQLVYPGDED